MRVQEDASNPLPNTSVSSIGPTMLALSTGIQSSPVSKIITITPDTGFSISPTDISISGASSSDDGTTRTITGSGGIWAQGVNNVVLTQSGCDVIATFDFGSTVMPSEDLTINVHFT